MHTIQRRLASVLKAQGVTTFESVGQSFDPAVHEAIGVVQDDEQETGTVLDELSRGYLWGDEVLRPAPASRLGLGWAAWFLGGLAVSLVAVTIAQAATVIAVSELHLDRPLAIGHAFAAIKGRVFELCLITVAIGVLVFLGFLALVIPGILL
ncbi:nucleotide exchange factor GrpE, partial [Lacticaseibacillus rhamnosus]